WRRMSPFGWNFQSFALSYAHKVVTSKRNIVTDSHVTPSWREIVSLTFSEAGVLNVNWISFGHCVNNRTTEIIGRDCACHQGVRNCLILFFSFDQAEGPSFPLPAHGLPMPPAVFKDLSTRLGNLEYRHRVLTRKIEEVSDAKVANSITIGEIHPKVATGKEQV
nr:hypothetical protein [Tanacetum cinerariifolium]